MNCTHTIPFHLCFFTQANIPTRPTGSGPKSAGPQLLAKARYNNVAEAGDELSFRQGDIVTVVKKDFNNQVDWWLCELRGKVGMVPANYLEVFHDYDASVYDIPRPNSKGPRPSISPQAISNACVSPAQPPIDAPIYDLPPSSMVEEDLDQDYDLPPAEANAEFDTYYRPPSSGLLSPHDSNRSSLKSINRISTASSAASSGGIYDIPPDPLDVYDFPKPNQPTRGFEDDGEMSPPSNVLKAVDISGMLDDEAEDLLTSYQRVISATYDVLFNSVYGPEAYWGTDNKVKRSTTLKTTFSAVKHFDRALLILLQFGKGVVNRLEFVSDANFKKKYLSAFKVLLHNRNDILGKMEALSSEIDSITGTVKSLLEIARTIPYAVTEFAILVQANKTILFKPSNKSISSLPVITKNEVKSRPLPELPLSKIPSSTSIGDEDYAIPTESELLSEEVKKTGHILLNHIQSQGDTTQEYGGTLRRRRPNDTLPPLPFATLPRNVKLSSIHSSRLSEMSVRTSVGSPYNSGVDGRIEVVNIAHPQPVEAEPEGEGEDYDEIDKTRERSIVITSRPTLASLGSFSGSRAGSPGQQQSPTHVRIHRHGSLSSCSSSDELHQLSNHCRSNSGELLDNPYGQPNNQGQSSSPQPLKIEERQILERFAKQFDLIIPGLRDAIDLLLDCLRENEAPKDFVTKSKLTLVAAYKLVYIADALSQKIVHTDTKTSITNSSNNLTESIKNLVTATKTAALQYPSVQAMDQMANNLKQLFPCALDLIDSVKSRAL